MLDILLFSFCVSLACTVIHVAITWEGMILNGQYQFYADNLPRWISKPLFDCLICMCSFWTVLFWVLYIKPITFELLFAVLITGGINTIISVIIENGEKSW